MNWVIEIAGKYVGSRGMVANIHEARKFDYETAVFVAKPYKNAVVFQFNGI